MIPIFVLSSPSGMAFILRYLSHWLILIGFLAYQLLFSQFVVPYLVFSIYSLVAVLFATDIFFLLIYKENSTPRFLEKFFFFLDSLGVLGLIVILGSEGLYPILFVVFLQILALSFYKSKILLSQFALWISLIFSFG